MLMPAGPSLAAASASVPGVVRQGGPDDFFFRHLQIETNNSLFCLGQIVGNQPYPALPFGLIGHEGQDIDLAFAERLSHRPPPRWHGIKRNRYILERIPRVSDDNLSADGIEPHQPANATNPRSDIFLEE